ncbi:hypothetical protein PTNB29_01639 [Pyrenophora teres f. teres]|nr:hypothetical protein PTNB29_01639 [Pyrenophora teres f. teres]
MSNYNNQEATSSNLEGTQTQQSQTIQSGQTRNYIPIEGTVALNTIENAPSPSKIAGKRTLEEFSRGINNQEIENSKRQRVGPHHSTSGNATPQWQPTDAQAMPNRMSDLARRRRDALIRARAIPPSEPSQQVGSQVASAAPIGGVVQIPGPLSVNQTMPMSMVPVSHPVNQAMVPVPAPAPSNFVNPLVTITKDLVSPVPELSLSWPLPKAVADPATRRSIRTSMVWNSQDPHPDDQRMVALRIEHDDLRYVDYSIVDMPILTSLLIQERVYKLNKALAHFMPRELRTRLQKPQLRNKTKPSEEVKLVVRWCKKKESIQLLVNFWDSDTMIEILRPFAETNRDLSIYDVTWLTYYVEGRRRAGFNAERDLQLPLPPRMQGPALLPEMIRNNLTASGNSTIRGAQPVPVVYSPVVMAPQQARGHPPVSGQPQMPHQQQVLPQPQAPLQTQAPLQSQVSSPSQTPFQTPLQAHVAPNLSLHQPAPKRPYVPDWLPPFGEGTRIVSSMSPRQRSVVKEPFVRQPFYGTAPGAAEGNSQTQEPPHKKFKIWKDPQTEAGPTQPESSTSNISQNVNNIPRNEGTEIPGLAHTQEGQHVQPLSDIVKGKRPVENRGSPLMLNTPTTATHAGGFVTSARGQQQHQNSLSPPASSKSTKGQPEDDEQSEDIGQANEMQKTQGSPEAGDELFADLINGKCTYEELFANLQCKLPALATTATQGAVPLEVPTSESSPQPAVASISKSTRENSDHLASVNKVPQVLGQKSPFKIEEGEYYPERFDPQKPEVYRTMLAHIKPKVVLRVNPFKLRYNRVRRPRDVEYHALPEVRDVKALNWRLNSILPRYTEAPHLLRNMPTPPAHFFSELTRCVRFAQSDAQKRVDWRLHPAHVYEIVQRSNFFGLELLISRSEIGVSSPATKEEFEMAMAMRLAHELFGKDPMMFVAADIPTMTAYLEGDVPSAMLLTTTEDDDVFGDLVEELSMKFSERYPSIDRSGQFAWMDLHRQVKNPESLQATVIKLILDKISRLGVEVHDESEGSLGHIHQNAGDDSIVNLESSGEASAMANSPPNDSVAVADGVPTAHLVTSQALSPVTHPTNDQTAVPDASTVDQNLKAAPLVDDETTISNAYSPEDEAHQQYLDEQVEELAKYRKEYTGIPEMCEPWDEDNGNTRANASQNSAAGSGTEGIAPQALQDDNSDGAALDGSSELGSLPQPTTPENLQPQQSFVDYTLDDPEAHGEWVMDNAGFGEFAAYPHFQPSDEPGWNEWVHANDRNLFSAQGKPSNPE